MQEDFAVGTFGKGFGERAKLRNPHADQFRPQPGKERTVKIAVSGILKGKKLCFQLRFPILISAHISTPSQ